MTRKTVLESTQRKMRAFPRFSSLECERRARSLQNLIEENSLKAVVINGSLGNVANLYYWSNYLPRSESFFITSDGFTGTLLVGTYNHIPTAGAMTTTDNVDWANHSPQEKVSSEIAKRLDSGQSQSKVGWIGNASHDMVLHLERKLDCNVIDLTKKANEVRSIKSEEEIEWLKKGAEFTDGAMKSLEDNLRLGMTEFDVCDMIERAYVNLGGTTRIHYVSSTSMRAPDVFVPWQHQRNRKLKKGDIVLTEVSAEYAGYAGQIHRPITIADKPTKEYSDLFEAALGAYENARSVLMDGCTTKDVVEAAESIVKHGYTVYDTVVHGFGVDLMFPGLGTSNSAYGNPDYTFREHMAVVIQPNPITPNRKYGLQLGNLCLVGKRRAESLQKYPLKFITIG